MFWFHRFMVGIHKRVGEIRRQDEALSIDILHEVDKILESRWRNTSDDLVCRRVAEMGVWIEFADTPNSVDKWMDKGRDSYFMFVVSGRLKGNQISGAKFSVPCVAVTEGTSLCPRRWIKRLVGIRKKEGTRTGRLFQRKLDPPRM
jgi:hypothetical protein